MRIQVPPPEKLKKGPDWLSERRGRNQTERSPPEIIVLRYAFQFRSRKLQEIQSTGNQKPAPKLKLLLSRKVL